MSSAMMHEHKANLKVGLVKQMHTEGDGRNTKELPATPSRYCKQQYRKAWEQLPEFNGWLEEVPENPTRAFCKVCSRNLHAHRLTLLKHTASIKHMKLAQEQFKAKQLVEAKARKKSLNNPNVVTVEVEVNPDEVEITSTIDNSTSVKSNDVTRVESAGTPCLLVPTQNTDSIIDNTNKDTAPQPEVVSRSPITTHVLDTSKGLPVPGLPVSIYQLVEGRWTYLNEAHTNPDGRCTNLLTKDDVKPGRFKLHFDTDKYFELRNNDRLFPFIETHNCHMTQNEPQEAQYTNDSSSSGKASLVIIICQSSKLFHKQYLFGERIFYSTRYESIITSCYMIVFDVRSPIDHLHIPLLMSPYGYTTYRGS